MNSKFVRQYLTQDFSINEKKSYIDYINGDEYSLDWVDKASIRREPLLSALSNQKCDVDGSCEGWVNVKENGKCECTFGHDCSGLVMSYIKKIISGKSF